MEILARLINNALKLEEKLEMRISEMITLFKMFSKIFVKCFLCFISKLLQKCNSFAQYKSCIKFILEKGEFDLCCFNKIPSRAVCTKYDTYNFMYRHNSSKLTTGSFIYVYSENPLAHIKLFTPRVKFLCLWSFWKAIVKIFVYESRNGTWTYGFSKFHLLILKFMLPVSNWYSDGLTENHHRTLHSLIHTYNFHL